MVYLFSEVRPLYGHPGEDLTNQNKDDQGFQIMFVKCIVFDAPASLLLLLLLTNGKPHMKRSYVTFLPLTFS